MRARTVALALAAATAVVAIALLRLKRPAWRRPWHRRGGPEPYRCDCGQAFRVAGSGRHRVYWIADAPQGDPLMSDRCPACDRPLPRELARRAEAAAAVT